MIWSLLGRLPSRSIQPTYPRYGAFVLTGVGLLAIYGAMSQCEDLVTTDLKIASLQAIAMVGATLSFIILQSDVHPIAPDLLPSTIHSAIPHKEQNRLATPPQSHAEQAHSYTSVQHLQEVKTAIALWWRSAQTPL